MFFTKNFNFSGVYSTFFATELLYNLSMEIIYVDSIFLLNLIVNYLLILITAKFCSIRFQRLRYILAASIGAFYAVMCFVPSYEFLNHPLIKLCLWGIISLVAFGREAKLFRCAVSFLVVSAAFGGGVWAISMFFGTSSFDGIFRLDLRIFALSFALCYLGLSLILSGKATKTKREFLEIDLVHRSSRIKLTALRDTGNSLRDLATGKNVIVVDLQTVSTIFTEKERKALSISDGTEAILDLSKIESAPKFRPIIYRAVGVELSIIPAFTPDEIYINGKLSKEYAVAVSPSPLGSEEYSAII